MSSRTSTPAAFPRGGLGRGAQRGPARPRLAVARRADRAPRPGPGGDHAPVDRRDRDDGRGLVPPRGGQLYTRAKDPPRGRTSRDVALVPERDVLEPGLRVAAQHPGQAGDPLGVIGLRLWGIADEPFWPAPNGSSTSRTSVRCRLRTSVAKRSRPAPASATAESSRRAGRAGRPAWRRPRAAARASPSPGLDRGRHRGVGADRARELADRDAARRPRSRLRLRSASKAKPARRSPKVVGSAWTPWVRPTQRCRACSSARATSASR